MATTIQLSWLSFSVPLNSVNSYFRANLASNYDGLVAQPAFLVVMFTSDCSDADAASVNSYWNSLTTTTFSPTMQQMVTQSIEAASDFGQRLIIQFSAQNVMGGITQAGKTIPVSNYLSNLNYYLTTGSLYAAITTIQGYIADTSSEKSALSPFITNAILYNFLNQIQAYLKIPLTTNPGT